MLLKKSFSHHHPYKFFLLEPSGMWLYINNCIWLSIYVFHDWSSVSSSSSFFLRKIENTELDKNK